ncbi:gliding motility-associated-like protein [Marinilabilia salmonicolor]|jgi:gliding motility-associated-like protein|nr:Calx-beta domain-containing protein [Marinilabilia salmonicolor]PRY96370.1 gliding motility-associated-like protein [Marinilabilia salmonicolor]
MQPYTFIKKFLFGVLLSLSGLWANAQNITLNISDASINETGGIATVTATTDVTSLSNIIVNLAFSGTATNGTDYTSDNPIVIPAGAFSEFIEITTQEDTQNELDESIIIDISSVINGTESGFQQVSTTIFDNDPEPTVSISASPISFGENGGSSTITASLSNSTYQPITVSIEAVNGTASNTDYILTSSEITIPAGDLMATTSITGTDDGISEGSETLSIDITGVSAGATEDGTQSQPLTITDNENVPTVSISASPTSFSENNGSSTITATLSGVSSQPITVTIEAVNGTASNTDYILTSTEITIPAGDLTANTSITGSDDGISEGSETLSIDITGISAGATEDGTQSQPLTIIDDEGTPTVSISASPTSFSENNGSSSITATLSGVSSQPITVTIEAVNATTSNTDYILTSTEITIPAGDLSANTSITGTDDGISEGSETLSIDITGVSAGATEDGTQSQPLTITDDEGVPTVTISASSTSFAENASTTITATLSNPSTQDIVVHLQVNNQNAEPEDYTVSANPVTIEAGNTTATTIISGVEDNFYEGNEHLNISISHTSGGAVDTGSNTPVTLSITDLQTPPLVSLSVSPASITENGSSTITATLSNPTFEEVTVSLSYSGDATRGEDYSLSSTNIVIPAFSSSASVTLSGTDDNIYETTENIYASISAVSGGSASKNGTQQQTIVLSDNDSAPLVTLSASPLSISENSNTTLTIALSNPTFENVLVNLEASTSGASENDYILSATSVTIPAGSENATTTLEGIPDNIFEGDEAVVVSISGTGGGGASIDNPHEVTITIEDAQSIPTVSLSFTGTPFSENGGTASLIAQLSHSSYQTVTVNIAYSGTASASDYSGEQAQIVIPSGNLSQSISIAGVNDLTAEGDETIVVTISSVENALENGIQEVSATILDDDVPGIRPTIFDANTITSENGLSDSFTIQLNTQPSSNVVVEITGLDNSEGALSTTEITFTPQNWNEAQLITITGVDDNEVDGNITYTLTLTVDDTQSDAAYHGIETTVEVTNNDNDSAGFDLNITNSHTQTNESGTRDVFTVVLLSQPTSNVVFAISGLDETEGALSSSALTFTPQNWNTQQTVTITGVDDDEVDGNIDYTLTVAVVDEQSDATYHGQSETLLVTNIDDDLAGLVVSTTNETLTTDETETSSSFEVSLSSRPASEVVISISGLDTSEGSLDKEQLTFTPDNWSQPQTVTLTGLDDFLVDGDISFTLSLTVENSLSSSDYHDLTTEISATNTDNDEAAIVITLANDELHTSEDGTPDSFTVRLNSQPINQVVINISGTDASEGTLNTNELIFSEENWNTEQTITITGVDDEAVDGDIRYTLTLTVDSDNSDGSYRDLFSLVEVLNTDDDEEVSNHAPTPGDDTYEMLRYDTLEGSSLLDNDSDPDDDTFYIERTPTVFPQNGTITIYDDGTFIYIPDPEFTGTDSFEYGICDNGTPTLCATATVTITVNDRFMDPGGDTDGDGIPDATEGDDDCDNDSYPDWIDPDGCYEEFQVTQGFSPNGDGLNDELTLGAFKDYNRVGIVVFSRWGEVVYENNNFRSGDSWDGTATSGFNKGEKLPSGTYYYVITIYDINKKLNGYFYIAR